MKKKFNIAGNCDEQKHYLMNNSKMLEQIMELIDYGDYFTINRPRQYGKTTILFQLMTHLEAMENFLPIKMDFQDMTIEANQSEAIFSQLFWQDMIAAIDLVDEEFSKKLLDFNAVHNFSDLSANISKAQKATTQKMVLLIDEVDASSNYEVFLKFLAMLRSKYLKRQFYPTFHSIVLAGVHDIKNLKYKLRNPEAVRYNSPWNIAVDFEVRMSFKPDEIVPMLEQYSEAEKVTMDTSAIAERLYYYTSGYPFLVSKLCKNIAEKILPKQANKTEWTLDDVEESVQLLLSENNTNFDDLIKNLENHQDLYDLVFRIVVDGVKITFNPHNSVISKGILYGIFKRNGSIRIHNRIYEQLIYSYMISNVEVSLQTENYNSFNQFQLPNNELDIQKVILKFQEFLKQEFTEKDQSFLERQWRIIFLAFLRPILNGSGYTFKEVQISEEKRLDVVVTYFQHQYIIELKRWYGEAVHQTGIEQLHDYLEKQNQSKGYLVIFEHRTGKTWRAEKIEHKEKEIFAVWV